MKLKRLLLYVFLCLLPLTARADNLIMVFLPAGSGTVPCSDTFNSGDKSADITLSNGDLTASSAVTDSNWDAVRGTWNTYYGLYYFEVTIDVADTSTNSIAIGVANSSASLTGYVGSDTNGWGYLADGRKGHGGILTAYGNSYTTGDVISVAVNLDRGLIWFAKNGTWQNSGDPVAISNWAYLDADLAHDVGIYPMVALTGDGGDSEEAQVTINFGSGFAYTVPTGYTALCSDNPMTAGVFWPAANTDDCFAYNTTYSNTWTTNAFGDGTAQNWQFSVRVDNVDIPQGSTISTAYLYGFTYAASSGTTCNALIYGNDVDDAAAPTNYSELNGMTHTTAYAQWDAVPAWSIYTEYQTPSLVSIITEIVERGSFAAGNHIQIHINNNSSSSGANRAWPSRNASTYDCVRLYVDWD